MSKAVTIHIPYDSIRFRLLPFDFNYFNLINEIIANYALI